MKRLDKIPKLAQCCLAIIAVGLEICDLHAAAGPGYALSFDGTSGYVSIPDNPVQYPGTGSFTIEAWIQTASTSSQYIVSKYECGEDCPGGANSLYDLDIISGRLHAHLRTTADTGAAQDLSGNRFLADGLWHHVTMVRDVAARRLYLYADGVLDNVTNLASLAS